MASSTLTSRTVHGIKWSLVAQVLNVATTIAATAVLARILTPAAFGLAAMAGIIVRFAQYFAQMGVGSALVQKRELTDEDIRASFTSSVLLGMVVCGVIVVATPLAHVVFKNPQVVPVARVMSLTFIIDGTSVTSGALLRRRLRFRTFAWMDTVAYVVGFGGVAIVMALLGFGVWSLVAASLALSAITTILYYSATRHTVRPLFRWSVYKPLFAFGARISVTQLLEFITYNMDTMWAGHYFSVGDVGTYSRGYTLASLPNVYLATTFSRVLFPSFSRIQKETKRIRDAYLPAIMVFAIIGTPLMWGIAAAAPQIVSVMLGGQWTAAVPVVRVLALAMPFSLLANFAGILCDATGRLNVKIVIRSSQIGLVLALFVALTRFGIVGVAVAYAAGQAFVAVALFFVVARILEIARIRLLRIYTPGVTAGLCATAAIGAASSLGTHLGVPALAILAIEMGLGLLIMMAWTLRARDGAAWRETRLRLVSSSSAPDGGRFSPMVRWLDAHASHGSAPAAAPGPDTT